MTSRYARKPVHTPRFSSLEIAVMQALAWELRATVSDLDAQFELASAGRRVNTGSGFHHEIIIDRNRKAPLETPPGLFGSVHALIDGLEDAVLFQVQLREGRLLALVADAYDQDTRDIDFMTAGYEQVFYLDADGASRLFDSSVLVAGNRPAWERTEWEPPEPLPPVYRYTPPPTVSRPAPAPARTDADYALADRVNDRWVVKLVIWAAVFVVALIAWLAAGLSLIFCLIAAFWIGSALTRGPAVDRIQDAFQNRRPSGP